MEKSEEVTMDEVNTIELKIKCDESERTNEVPNENEDTDTDDTDEDTDTDDNGDVSIKCEYMEEIAITEQPVNTPIDKPYEEVYRTGNFGIVLGKLNIRLARKWMIAHSICTLAIFILTIIGTILLNKFYTGGTFTNIVLSITYLSSIFGVSSAAVGGYFFWNMKILSRPYAVFMTLRFLAIINWVFVFIGIFLVLVVIVSANNPKNRYVWIATSSEIAASKAIYIIMLILMLVEMVVSFTFVSSPGCSDVCNECSCCGPCCMYEAGEEIAPGVANPPSQDTWMEVARVAMQVNTGLGKIEDKMG